MGEINFDDIRDDWYRANQLLPRLVRKALLGRQSLTFLRFPRQWIPIFEYYGLAWRDCRPPVEHVPLISELSDSQLARHCRMAERLGTLRTLVESIVVLDPVLADFLYIIDHSSNYAPISDEGLAETGAPRTIRLTSWQSYGRPAIQRFDREVSRVGPRKPVAVVLPCSRRRPYGGSRTHQRIWRSLKETGVEQDEVHQVVLTSLGVVPQELWKHPVVMGYDAGVPDIYRILRLTRLFFGQNHYSSVVDCLEFAPYSDLLGILQREGAIARLSVGPARRNRQFYVKIQGNLYRGK